MSEHLPERTAVPPLASLGFDSGTEAAALFSAYYGPLAGWCSALVSDGEIGKDLAAEAFVRLLARWARVRDPKPFLYAVAANLVKDHWRHTQRRPAVAQSEHDVGDSRYGGDAASDDPAYGNVEVRELVQKLPARLRVPVLLHYYADCSIADVARSTRRPIGTVKRQLAEARTLLRKEIRE